VAIYVPPAPILKTSSTLSAHRAETERAIATIKYDNTLNDWEKAQRITGLLAEANARFLARHPLGR
jgi:hypothetical protein